MIQELEKALGIKPKIAINLCTSTLEKSVEEFISQLNELGYKTYKRYVIEGYPRETNKVVSEKGYGSDEYIPISKPLVIVTGAASNSGKMSTCLGQIYHDQQKGISSGYAKYETFPIWTLPLEHPVNLAYEAATADIGDYNMIDTYHLEAYGQRSVNYNRDVEAFEIIQLLSDKIVERSNFMRNYRSPTDMGINHAGFAITDDEVVCIASLREIKRRANWYSEIAARGQGTMETIQKCLEIEKKAVKYINDKGYNLNLHL
ncbi:MAG: hypothetical protein Fur003_6060 [Candidatus Dojkabacteria bacterium]